MQHTHLSGTPFLQTTVLPKLNCSNCNHFIPLHQEILQPESISGLYAVECRNLVHPLEDCILRGFKAHSEVGVKPINQESIELRNRYIINLIRRTTR